MDKKIERKRDREREAIQGVGRECVCTCMKIRVTGSKDSWHRLSQPIRG